MERLVFVIFQKNLAPSNANTKLEGYSRLQDADCILWGLGRSLNKQKPGISDKDEMPGFVPLYIRGHCLLIVSGILDTNSYPDFRVIPTFQKSPEYQQLWAEKSV